MPLFARAALGDSRIGSKTMLTDLLHATNFVRFRPRSARHGSFRASFDTDARSQAAAMATHHGRALLAVAVACMMVAASATLPDVGKDMADIVSEKGYPIEECA